MHILLHLLYFLNKESWPNINYWIGFNSKIKEYLNINLVQIK